MAHCKQRGWLQGSCLKLELILITRPSNTFLIFFWPGQFTPSCTTFEPTPFSSSVSQSVMRILVKWDGYQIVDKNDEEFHFSPICFRPLVQKTTSSSKGSVCNPAHTNMCVKATTTRSSWFNCALRDDETVCTGSM